MQIRQNQKNVLKLPLKKLHGLTMCHSTAIYFTINEYFQKFLQNFCANDEKTLSILFGIHYNKKRNILKRKGRILWDITP